MALFYVMGTSAQLTTAVDGYYRIQNSQYTTHYLGLANHLFDYTPIIDTAGGGLTALALNTDNAQDKALECAKAFLTTDIKIVADENCTNVSTIIYINKYTESSWFSTKTYYNFIAQGTSLLALTTGTRTTGGQHPEFKIGASIDKVSGTSGANTKYKAYMNIDYIGDIYFMDDNGTMNTASSGDAANTRWYITPITSFNANAQVEHNGKYYTTMYTAFAYQLGTGVENAYVVSDVDLTNHRITLTTVATNGETVPAGTPVVLECNSEMPSLIPTGVPLACDPVQATSYAPDPSTATNYSGTNYLSGTYYCNTDGNLTYTTFKNGTSSIKANDYKSNNQSTMRVLGVNSQGKIGFFKLSNNVQYMAANKAWLDISPFQSSVNVPSSFSISFNGISDEGNDEQLVSEDGGFPDSIEAFQNGEYHGVVYDLQGRRLSSENLTKGIYIVNGKKVFIQ